MTVNISSLQSELLKLLSNGKDDEMEINEVDEMTQEEKNSVDIADVLPNADLKGGNDIADIVDNILTGGNVNEDKPEEKGTSEKEILSNILLDDKKEEGVDGNDTSEKEILTNILLDDKEGMSGGKKKKGNKKVKKEKESEQDGQNEPLADDELNKVINEMIENDDNGEKQNDPNLSVLDVETSSGSESDKEASNSENENSDEKDESDLSNDTHKDDQNDKLNEDFNDEYTSEDESDSDSDSEIPGGDLSDKYISIINEFTSTPKLSGGLVGGGSSSSSSSRIKLIPMFPYIVKAYD